MVPSQGDLPLQIGVAPGVEKQLFSLLEDQKADAGGPGLLYLPGHEAAEGFFQIFIHHIFSQLAGVARRGRGEDAPLFPGGGGLCAGVGFLLSLRGAKRRGNPFSLGNVYDIGTLQGERIAAPVCGLARNDRGDWGITSERPCIRWWRTPRRPGLPRGWWCRRPGPSEP